MLKKSNVKSINTYPPSKPLPPVVAPIPPPGGWILNRYQLDASGLTLWTNEPNTTGFCIRHHNVNAMIEALRREGDPRIAKGILVSNDP